MADTTETEALYNIATNHEAKKQRLEIDGVEHFLIPPGSTLKSLEHLLPFPVRIRSCAKFHDLDGFADYAKEFSTSGSMVFVNEKERKFTIVFDADVPPDDGFDEADAPPAGEAASPDSPQPGRAGWGEHTAHLVFNLSHEWERFKKYDGQQMSAMQFAEFLEDNIDYISATVTKGEESVPITGADLLSMAQQFKIRLKNGQNDVHETLKEGVRKIQIVDESETSGVKGDGVELPFPDQLCVNMRIFHNHTAYAINVWLRYRKDDGTLFFLIKIPDVAGIQEKAFEQLYSDVREKLGMRMAKGEYFNNHSKT